MTNRSDWLDSTSASRVLGVSPSTLRAWARDGRISAWQTVGGRYLYARDDVMALLPTPVLTTRREVALQVRG